MTKVRYRFWNLLDRIGLPRFLPYRTHLAWARFCLDRSERAMNEALTSALDGVGPKP